jgi:hypothetical protein
LTLDADGCSRDKPDKGESKIDHNETITVGRRRGNKLQAASLIYQKEVSASQPSY